MLKRKFSRRDFLLSAAAVSGGAVLAACAQATATIAPQPTSAAPMATDTPLALATDTPAPTSAVMPTDTPAPTAVPTTLKPTKILMWDDCIDPSLVGTPADKFWTAMHTAFSTAHPEVQIEFQPIVSGTEVRKDFITAHAAGNAPDLFYTYPPSMNPYYVAGFLLPMDNYVYGWNHFNDVVPALWYDAKQGQNNHYYGIPCDFYGMCLWYRKDLFAAAGLTAAPTTWDELVADAQKLTIPAKNQYGFGLLGMAWASWYWENFVWQEGGEVTTPQTDGSVTLTFTDDPGVQALQFYQDLKFKYKVTQKNVLQDYASNTKDFEAGRTAMWMAANTSGSGFITDGLKLEQMGVVALPAGPTGIKKAQIGGGYWTINAVASKDNQDAAWTYAAWRTEPDTWKLFWKTQNDTGVPPTPWIAVYKQDLGQGTIQPTLPAEWVQASNDTGAIAHTEYRLKDQIEPYIATPVQTVLTSASAKCKDELVACAKKIVGEIQGTKLAASAGA
jgi:ABC-type glycerol-3-phosphate transport system substrate-binding protein